VKKTEDIHMKFRDVVSVNLLFAALEKDFPLLHSNPPEQVVDAVEIAGRERVFNTIREFSTSFPHFSTAKEPQ